MLHQISWQIYFEAIFTLIIVYYACLAFAFYHHQAGLFIRNHILHEETGDGREVFYATALVDARNDLEVSYPPGSGVSGEEYTYAEGSGDSHEALDDMIFRLKNVIRRSEAGPDDALKLAGQIKSIFTDYESFKTSPYRDAINELIVTEYAKMNTPGTLTQEQVSGWWNDIDE
ncbi:MAG: hypothetical protein ACHQHN_13890 [Sphingobacteriales bacterium]